MYRKPLFHLLAEIRAVVRHVPSTMDVLLQNYSTTAVDSLASPINREEEEEEWSSAELARSYDASYRKALLEVKIPASGAI